ncbi:MAG TPA: hypothetical protein VJC39_04325 [Candidatus Nanoarchaeia archaeon]|nr:hypothetical protein [Candidatus Nanoarchaeia archaeon]
MEQYLLLYSGRHLDALCIRWVNGPENKGNCRVEAILGSTNLDEHQNSTSRMVYSDSNPLTLDLARTFIAQNSQLLGSNINDCVGLYLRAQNQEINFAEAVRVKSK